MMKDQQSSIIGHVLIIIKVEHLNYTKYMQYHFLNAYFFTFSRLYILTKDIELAENSSLLPRLHDKALYQTMQNATYAL